MTTVRAEDEQRLADCTWAGPTARRTGVAPWHKSSHLDPADDRLEFCRISHAGLMRDSKDTGTA
ncbi:hypothetical protein GCM10023148_37400 [Actinokineospora soli]